MKKTLLYSGFTLVAVATYVFFPTNKIAVVDNMSTQTAGKKSTVSSEVIRIQAQEVKTSEDSLTKSEIQSFHDSVPDKDQVNEEFVENPHTPSSSLMTFSKRLGPLMEKAFKNEKDANALVTELTICAKDKSVAKAARATCVTSTERLSESYPSLKEKAQKLRASAAPEVRKILDTNDAFNKKL